MNDSMLSWQTPLQFIRDGVPLVVVPAFVNDRGPFVFILDTGNATAPFILSRRAAEKLKIEARPSSEFAMPSVVGTQPTELLAATADSVALGPFRQNNLRIGVSKAMDQLSRAIGKDIDGNIGYPFLKQLRVTIDYRRRVLAFGPSISRPENNEIGFDLGSPKPLILIWATVNGSRPYRFAVDSGAGTTIVSTELAHSLRLPEGVRVPMHGAGGPASGTVTQLSSISFGHLSLQQVDVVAADVFASLRAPVGGELDGVIGYNVMRQFCVTIDYPMRRMLFES